MPFEIVERLAISFVNGKSLKILNKDVEQLNVKQSSFSFSKKVVGLFTDAFELMWEDAMREEDILVDTGTQLAFQIHAVHGVDPMEMSEFTQWETDIPDEKIIDALKDTVADEEQ